MPDFLGSGMIPHVDFKNLIDKLFILHTADMAENGIRVRDSLADLERYRLQLEQNVAKLRASLGHWQTWEIEYEGMKEEILELGEVHSSSDLVYGSLSLGCESIISLECRKTLVMLRMNY